MKEVKIIFNSKDSSNIELTCKVAKNLLSKMKGLMNVEELDTNKGMFFPFLIPWYRYFWMKNVKIPLDIIFVNKNYEIISIHEAQVEVGFFYKNYSSKGFCKYVVETNMGFCKEHNIKIGTKIKIKKEN